MAPARGSSRTHGRCGSHSSAPLRRSSHATVRCGRLLARLRRAGFRYKHPAGLLSLGSFTALEAFAVGASVSFYDQQIVLQALLITCVRLKRLDVTLTLKQFVVVGLTLFTFNSRYDFSSLGPWLTIPLLVLVGTGLIGILSVASLYSRIADATQRAILQDSRHGLRRLRRARILALSHLCVVGGLAAPFPTRTCH